MQQASIALLLCDFCPQPLIEAKSIAIACIGMPGEMGAVMHLGNLGQLGHQCPSCAPPSHLLLHKEVIKPDTWLSRKR